MVGFDDDGSYVLNKMTGEVNWMREESGNYIMHGLMGHTTRGKRVTVPERTFTMHGLVSSVRESQRQGGPAQGKGVR